jgi:sodium/hydrogen exchanger 8
VYATATLSICIFTTIVCGGLTEGMLTRFSMKIRSTDNDNEEDEFRTMNRVSFSPPSSSVERRANYPIARQASRRVYKGAKRLWKQFDDDVLKTYFGGSTSVQSGADGRNGSDHLGNYELGMSNRDDADADDDYETEGGFTR